MESSFLGRLKTLLIAALLGQRWQPLQYRFSTLNCTSNRRKAPTENREQGHKTATTKNTIPGRIGCRSRADRAATGADL